LGSKRTGAKGPMDYDVPQSQDGVSESFQMHRVCVLGQGGQCGGMPEYSSERVSRNCDRIGKGMVLLITERIRGRQSQVRFSRVWLRCKSNAPSRNNKDWVKAEMGRPFRGDNVGEVRRLGKRKTV